MKTLLNTAITLLLLHTYAQAHFIWLAPVTAEDGTTHIEVYFGESAIPDDPDLLKHVDGMQAWTIAPDETYSELELVRNDDSLRAQLSDPNALIVAKHNLGVMQRGDKAFVLNYYAKTGATQAKSWGEINCSRQIALDLIPKVEGEQLHLSVRFNGEAVPNAEVVSLSRAGKEFEGSTDEAGIIAIPFAEQGLYSIRARVIENKSGELDGKPYSEVRHYCTLTLKAQSVSLPAAGKDLQPLGQPVTSFGGAIMNGKLYIYGGHTGGAHSYSLKEQENRLHCLNLRTGEWQTLAEGPRLQGLALIAHGDKLYRIGGFTAKNAEGEDHSLWSQDSVAAFDTTTQQWKDLPSLPEPRSSFDAAVLNDVIYVIGGWHMAGDADSIWHKTAWKLDLSKDQLQWEALPEPPFQRRALAVAVHDGKVYAIGGMQSEGGPTIRTDIFDPQTQTWSQGPNLVVVEKEEDGSPFSNEITGFGASAFATGGDLYVSTIKGTLQRLTDDGSAWEVVTETPTARFFHRMLPVDQNHLLIVGGANMGIGKFEDVEIIDVSRYRASH